jgi:hypothetical protein
MLIKVLNNKIRANEGLIDLRLHRARKMSKIFSVLLSSYSKEWGLSEEQIEKTVRQIKEDGLTIDDFHIWTDIGKVALFQYAKFHDGSKRERGTNQETLLRITTRYLPV